MATFALIGAAGYIAPRHMKAMKSVGGDLQVAYDPHDSVGVLDSYFPDAHFFTEFERFDRHVDKLQRSGEKIQYMAVCTPNYLHDAHCRFALRSDADVICEKPTVLNPWNIDGLAEMERHTGRKVATILQLRLHPAIQALKAKVNESSKNEFSVDLTYVVPRGRWYRASWKGDEKKSGGITTNLGVHFFDMLTHVFGPTTMKVVHLRDEGRMAGFLQCGRAAIRWFLSIEREDLPPNLPKDEQAYRSITIDSEELLFSDGFADLHTRSYEHVFAEGGFDLATVRPTIEIVSALRNMPIESQRGERHQFVSRYATS